MVENVVGQEFSPSITQSAADQLSPFHFSSPSFYISNVSLADSSGVEIGLDGRLRVSIGMKNVLESPMGLFHEFPIARSTST